MSTENPKAVGKRFLKGVFPYWPQIVKTVLCMTVMVGFSLLIPLFTKLVIDRAITQQDQKLLWIVCLRRGRFHLRICFTFSNTRPILHLYNTTYPT